MLFLLMLFVMFLCMFRVFIVIMIICISMTFNIICLGAIYIVYVMCLFVALFGSTASASAGPPSRGCPRRPENYLEAYPGNDILH